MYAGVSDCKIEEGSMRCDANISISKTEKLGTKVEIKNIGSITNVGLAIDYESKRQQELLDKGETLREETRRYDATKNKTILMRVKETGNDYRYFPEPDIPYLVLTDEIIENAIKEIPTMANTRREKYLNAGISLLNANKLIANKELSDYLEKFKNINLKTASNLLLGDIQAYLNKTNKKIIDTNLTNDKFITLINYLDDGKISHKNFKDIIEEVMGATDTIDTILDNKGIKNVVDNSLVETIIDKVINDNLNVVNDYKNGNDRSLKFLMGQVMKESKGSVNPKIANDLLIEKLKK